MQGIILVVGAVLGLFSFFGPIVGFIWTGVLGEWSVFFLALCGSIGGAFVVSLFMMPAVLFGGLAEASLVQGRNAIGLGFGAVSLLWTLFAVAGWCYLVQMLLIGRADYGHYWPFGLMACGVSLAPLAKMARADGNNPYTQVTLLGVSFATVIHVLYSIAEGEFNPAAFVLIYGVLIAIVAIVSMAMIALERRSY